MSVRSGRIGQLSLLMLLLALPLRTLAAGGNAPGRAVVLFAPDEASQLRFSNDDWPQVRRSRAIESGPRVVFQHPAVHDSDAGPTVEMTTPGSLLVRFEPNQAPVDMNSLQVTARKGFFSKSLTELLRPYVHGATVDVSRLEIPTGKFLIEIAVADQQGTKTVASYRFQVSEGSP
jgi:hypothetical protein